MGDTSSCQKLPEPTKKDTVTMNQQINLHEILTDAHLSQETCSSRSNELGGWGSAVPARDTECSELKHLRE